MPRQYKDTLRLQGKERARNINFIAWPDSVNMERLDLDIERSHVKAARSPLHDRDQYDRADVEQWLHRHGMVDFDLDWTEGELHAYVTCIRAASPHLGVPWIGDLKKPHYHYILIFDGNKGLRDLEEVTGGQIAYFEKAISKNGSLNYLIHRNAPTKAQYAFEDIKAFNGVDLSPIVALTELESMDYFKLIQDHIMRDRVTNMWSLTSWAAKQNDFNVQKTLKNNWGYFNRLMYDGNSMRQAAKRAIGPTPKALEDFEEGMFKTGL